MNNTIKLFIASIFVAFLNAEYCYAQDSIPTTSSNTNPEQIPLVFKEKRKKVIDTFNMDTNRTIFFLKDSLMKSFKIRPPEAWSNRLNMGGYMLESMLVANNIAQRSDNKTLKDIRLKPFDIIEIDYYMSQRAIMACRLPNVVFKINGLKAFQERDVKLTIGDSKESDKTLIQNEVYYFWFDFIGLCNPDSWTAKLEIGEEVFYLFQARETDFSSPFEEKPIYLYEFDVEN